VTQPARPADRPSPFAYLDGVLHVGGVPLDQVVAATGTPAYVYDLDAVAAAWVRLSAALAPIGGRGLFSVKANSNLALLRRLAGLGAGFDVVSGGELLRVLRAGADPSLVVFAGVGKTAAELALATGHGVLLHVESVDELELLQQVAAAPASRCGSTRTWRWTPTSTSAPATARPSSACRCSSPSSCCGAPPRASTRPARRSVSTSTSAPSSPTPTAWSKVPASA
jgi:diaminopimelate decarboxylase